MASPWSLFGILFFRLWFLQILNGEAVPRRGQQQPHPEFRVSAPRGNILDRDGDILVANRISLALQVNPAKLPEEEDRRHAELKQLAGLVHTTLPKLRRNDARRAENGAGLRR